jgi:hypothetical protein
MHSTKDPSPYGCGKVQIASDALERYVVAHVLDFVSKAHLRPSLGEDELLEELLNALDRDDESRKQLDRERFILQIRDETSYRPIYEELTRRIESQRLQLVSLMARRDERQKALMPGDRNELQRYWEDLNFDEMRAALRGILREVVVVSSPVKGGNVFRGDERVRLEYNWTAYMAAAEEFESNATPEEMAAAEEEYRRLNEESLVNEGVTK